MITMSLAGGRLGPGEQVMARRRWALVAIMGLFLHTGPAWCQQAGPTAPALLPTPTAMPTATPTARPAPYVLPPVDQPPEVEPIIRPFLDDAPVGPPGLFAAVDLFVIRPHVFTHFSGSPNATDTVTLMTAGPWDTTVSPEFKLGYRLPEQLGEFAVDYRFQTDARTRVPSDNLGGLSEHDRLGMNLFNVDWGKDNPFSLGPGWDLRVNIGVRVAEIYFQTEREFGPAGNAAGQLSERVTSNFVGVGPEGGMELSREVFLPGLAIFGRVSGAYQFGNIHQTFAETTVGPGSAAAGVNNQVWVPQLTLQAGLSYEPPGWNHTRFQLGYVWEEFWHFVRSDFADANRGDILNRGFVFRAEWNF
jgi:hypothetical protein